MKINKKGSFKDGVIEGFIIDCEGKDIDLDEVIAYTKIIET